MTLDFITTPTDQVEKSRTFVGVREVVPSGTLDQIEKRMKRHKGHKPKHVNWGGQDWVLDEYSDTAPDKSAMSLWVAYAIHGPKEYLILAQVPNDQRHAREQAITQTMSSVRFLK